MAVSIRAPRVAARAAERLTTLRLLAVVFLAGSASMATEICASRLLAPYYGSSTVVWANVIGLVLASLALGYWLGGRLADRRPSPRVLGLVLLAAAALVAVAPYAARPSLSLATQGLDELAAGTVVGSFFGALVLFGPPVTLLGMVAPFAIRLGISDVREAGAVAGRVFGLSTAGSLVGTWLSALVTIPLIGTHRTLLGASAGIALGAAALLGARWLAAPLALGALLALPPGAVRARSGLLYERESPYQFVQVVDRGNERVLLLDEGLVVHSVWRRGTVFTGGEWDLFLAVPPLLARPPEQVAILGNAGGTTARALGRIYPRARIDGVELDPSVSEAGRRYLGLGENPNLRVVDADARPFLRRAAARYDLIVIDAYRPPYVPFYLATSEFFALVRDRLRPGGAVAVNVATVPGDHRLAAGLGRTLATEFPQVLGWQGLRFNQLVVGFTEPLGRDTLAARAARAPPSLRALARLLAREAKPVAPGAPWTDDRAPVEWVTDRMVIEYAARGVDLDERTLPTSPP